MFGNNHQTFYSKAKAFIAGDISEENDYKLKVLNENYADQHLVFTAPEEIQDIRRSAQRTGLAISIAAFGLNEAARLTLRTRKF